MPELIPPTDDQRLHARQRPERTHVMYQRWEQLLFLHWKWEPAEIQKTLPPGLYVDTFGGDAWLGVVPFYMRAVRPRFLPAVGQISNFLEVNLRTYVHDAQGRPGVWFYSLDCNQPVAVKVARTFFHIPYFHAEMRAEESAAGLVHYSSRRHGDAATSVFEYQLARATSLAEPGTLEFFLVERYLLFAWTRGGLRWGQIYHTPYPVTSAEVSHFDTRLFSLNDFPAPTSPPDHVMGSPSVSVIFYPLQNVGRY
jgi:uncharacterized protein YqjF (DUF2071 family)